MNLMPSHARQDRDLLVGYRSWPCGFSQVDLSALCIQIGDVGVYHIHMWPMGQWEFHWTGPNGLFCFDVKQQHHNESSSAFFIVAPIASVNIQYHSMSNFGLAPAMNSAMIEASNFAKVDIS
jgi:hypothetical protein